MPMHEACLHDGHRPQLLDESAPHDLLSGVEGVYPSQRRCTLQGLLAVLTLRVTLSSHAYP